MSIPASAAPIVPAPGNLSALLFDPAAAERLFSLLNPVFAPGEGLVVQFISANSGEGVSTLARDFALMATQYIDGDVLLLDLSGSSDASSQFSHFQQCGAGDPMLALSTPQPLAPAECGPLLRLPNRDATTRTGSRCSAITALAKAACWSVAPALIYPTPRGSRISRVSGPNCAAR